MPIDPIISKRQRRKNNSNVLNLCWQRRVVDDRCVSLATKYVRIHKATPDAVGVGWRRNGERESIM